MALLRDALHAVEPVDHAHTARMALRELLQRLSPDDWSDAGAKSLAVRLAHEGSTTFLLLLNAADGPVEFQVPRGAWRLALSSDPEQEVGRDVETLLVGDHSVTLLRERPTA